MLSKILVPDPIRKSTWDETVHRWESQPGKESLLVWLLRNGIVEETSLIEALQTATGAPLGHLDRYNEVEERPPQSGLLEQLGFVYLGQEGDLHVLAGGPDLPPSLEPILGPHAFHWQWVLMHPDRSKIVAPFHGIEGDGAVSESPRNWLDDLIQGLIVRGATDIHFELAADKLDIRFHAGRSLEAGGHWEGDRAKAAMQLLKTQAGLAGATRGPPMDGLMKLNGVPGGSSARLSHLTTVDGESVVLRIPKQELSALPLPELGMPPELMEECLDSVLANPGLILCCGPTGSGKTTTLYSLMHELSRYDLKIITIEDPVEQELPDVVQCPVNEARGWTFASAVRSFLRQDPDVIMVGEVRDANSAIASCRAALSGHAVLSTMHARNTDAALHRLLAWGVPPGILADSVRLVVNQRLSVEDPSMPKAEFTWKVIDPCCLPSALQETAIRPYQAQDD
ncbi:MAG: GspE/PulE family protein [Puniceicoccaceae bacterium]